MRSIAVEAERASHAGMLSTIPMRARKGRASYLGWRSEGHQDPGATSAHLIFATLVDLTLDLSRWAFVLVLLTGWALSELILRLLRPTARESVE